MRVMRTIPLISMGRRLKLQVIGLAACVPLALGAQDSTTSVADQLKDLKRSGESCRRADLVPSTQGVAQRKNFQADPSCAISAQEMQLWMSAGQLTVVDTRTADEYKKYRLDSSVHLALGDVSHKPQLRNSSIALVGSGRQEKELYVACAKLKAEGFKSVQVLHGGLPSWLNLQQRLKTDAGGPQVPLTHLDAAELFAESQFDANFIVISPTEVAMRNELVHAVSLANESVDEFKKIIDTQRRNQKTQFVNAVIWVTSSQTKSDFLNKLREAVAPTPFLVYSEGQVAYQRYVKEQKAVWLAYTRGPKQPTCGL